MGSSPTGPSKIITMKKFMLTSYLILTISVMLTAASWFTWGNTCEYIYSLPEGSSYSGMCAGDGVQFVGIFGLFVIIASLYILLTAVLFRYLGYKLVKK